MLLKFVGNILSGIGTVLISFYEFRTYPHKLRLHRLRLGSFYYSSNKEDKVICIQLLLHINLVSITPCTSIVNFIPGTTKRKHIKFHFRLANLKPKDPVKLNVTIIFLFLILNLFFSLFQSYTQPAK